MRVCCWQYFKARLHSKKFETSENIRKQLESPFQKFLTYKMFINYVLICASLVFPYLVILFTGDTVIKVYERGEGCDGGVVYLVEYFICFLIPMVYLIYLVVFEWMTLLKW